MKREKNASASGKGNASQLKTNTVSRGEGPLDLGTERHIFLFPGCPEHSMQDLFPDLPADRQASRVSEMRLNIKSRCSSTSLHQIGPARRKQAQQDRRRLFPWQGLGIGSIWFEEEGWVEDRFLDCYYTASMVRCVPFICTLLIHIL